MLCGSFPLQSGLGLLWVAYRRRAQQPTGNNRPLAVSRERQLSGRLSNRRARMAACHPTPTRAGTLAMNGWHHPHAMTVMHLTFDTFDWICGLLLNGVLAFCILAAITASGRPLLAVLVTACMLIVSFGSAALVNLLLQVAVSPSDLASASYKRRALLSWLPWPMGLVSFSLPVCAYAAWGDRQKWRMTLRRFGPQDDVRKRLHAMLSRTGQDLSCGLPCLHGGGQPCTTSGRCEVRASVARANARPSGRKPRRRRRILWDN
jgi:hypothetical protein